MTEMHFVCNLDAAQFTDETIIMYLRKEAVNEPHTLMQKPIHADTTRVTTEIPVNIEPVQKDSEHTICSAREPKQNTTDSVS